jgi:undecaprenyl-diphosphatase
MRLGATDSFDRALLLAMRRSAGLSMAGPRWLSQAALDITGLGSTTIVFLAVAASAMFLTFRRRGRDALWLSVCVASGYVLMRVLKVAFDRPRPEIVPHAVRVTDASFPSGHAMLAAITYWTLAAVITRGQFSHRARIFIWSVVSLLILMIGWSRVYLGVHWPTDVLAGWIAGGVWALFCSTEINRASFVSKRFHRV